MLSGDNAELLDELYSQYEKNPGAVSPEWADYFSKIEGSGNGHKQQSPSWTPQQVPVGHKDIGVSKLIESYRRHGHLAAKIDPLNLWEANRSALKLETFGLSETDLSQEFDTDISVLGRAKLSDIISWMEKTYCSSIGAEHFYLTNDEERNWLQERMESQANSEALDLRIRLRLYEKLYQAQYFEMFLAQTYVGKKRFSLEGSETMIPMLDAMIEEAGSLNMDHIVLGMAHRGRLNVLVNVLQKAAGQIFAEFEENYNPETIDYADVKYHLGFSNTRMTFYGKEVKLSLAFNPSHLEAVDPVILGSIKAKQVMNGDHERARFMPVMLHGDAAFPGQGVVAESLNLMNLHGYRVGGTMHIVVNNQIGFTALPHESRSTRYCTDLAKGFEVPIFHVNADDPQAVYRIVKLCMAFRRKFRKDCIIDLVSYRRLGHNETDEPSFTQPLLYDAIKKHPPTVEVYEKELLTFDDVTEDDIQFVKMGTESGLQNSFKKSKDKNVTMAVDTLKGNWAEYSKQQLDSEPQTKLLKDQMGEIVRALTTVPEGFNLNRKLKRVLDAREKMFKGEEKVDWSFAEALAFGSILMNGHEVRLTGQDVKRGTFSHRHAVMVDGVTAKQWIPLNGISQGQAGFHIYNSPLSEYACLGFEYGYSLSNPRTLVLWEAQFGDFVNGAQIMIDQFITCSEVKWYRMSGLVMLLPHGYEGQGPEHSSARLERFLQLCAGNNIQVCNCTTPAQYFHLLRRQSLRRFRKPLVILTPKSLLRLKEAGSKLSELRSGVFQNVLDDDKVEPQNVKRIVFCSGKVFYDFEKRREEMQVDNVAIVRLEQLYPFPKELVEGILKRYSNAKEVCWMQEEPENMGAWFYVDGVFYRELNLEIKCISRPESPSPAAGLMSLHKHEQLEIVTRALA